MPEVIHSQQLDSAGLTPFFARELEFIKAKTYDKRYPELKARALIPVSNDGGPGVDTITYRQYDMFGAAKIINSYADDLPRADVTGKEFRAPVRDVGVAYGYSLNDIEAAKYSGMPLEQRKANAALHASEQSVNSIAWFGNSDAGLPGFFSNPNVPVAAVADTGVDSNNNPSTLWVNKTPDQILYDMNECANGVMNNTLGIEQPDTLLLPLSRYNLIVAKARSSVSDTTILNYFLENNPYIKSVEWLNELETAGSGSTAMMVAYRRDPDKIELRIPVDFMQLPVQERGLEFVIPCRLRTGGVVMPYPMSANFAYGI